MCAYMNAYTHAYAHVHVHACFRERACVCEKDLEIQGVLCQHGNKDSTVVSSYIDMPLCIIDFMIAIDSVYIKNSLNNEHHRLSACGVS